MPAAPVLVLSQPPLRLPEERRGHLFRCGVREQVPRYPGRCGLLHRAPLGLGRSPDFAPSGSGHLGPRRVPRAAVGGVLRSPDRNIMAETALQPAEILTTVSVPRTSPYHRSIYLKAKERQAYDFALASVALAVELSDGLVRDARIVIGGVAPVPLRVPHAKDALKGRSVEEVDHPSRRRAGSPRCSAVEGQRLQGAPDRIVGQAGSPNPHRSG